MEGVDVLMIPPLPSEVPFMLFGQERARHHILDKPPIGSL
jgi:hypothetical protein